MTSVVNNKNSYYKDLKNELKKRRPNLINIQNICNTKESVENIITPSIRPHLYCSLLRLEKTHIQRSADALLKKELLTTENDLDNQRVIKADTKRTNSIDPFFKKEETQDLMENILTFYCKRRSIKYIQGLNFVLAPFLKMLDTSLSDHRDEDDAIETMVGPGAIFELFYGFVNKVLPNIYM